MARVGPVYEMTVSRPQPCWRPNLAGVGGLLATSRELPRDTSGNSDDPGGSTGEGPLKTVIKSRQHRL